MRVCKMTVKAGMGRRFEMSTLPGFGGVPKFFDEFS